VERVAMDEIFPARRTNDEISMERCRELLGEEASVDTQIRQLIDTSKPAIN
jgi:hypothetical protein